MKLLINDAPVLSDNDKCHTNYRVMFVTIRLSLEFA